MEATLSNDTIIRFGKECRVLPDDRVFLKKIAYGRALDACIRFAFKDDTDLAKYHIKPQTTSNYMARHTFGEIGKSKGVQGAMMLCYAVYHKNGPTISRIGFAVLCFHPVPILYSFGINVAYRKPEILKAWVLAMEEKFEGQNYAVTLNQKNTRAIRFFERNGFVQRNVDKKHKIVSLSK